MKTDLRSKLLAEMPPVVSRKEAARFTGGLLSPGTLANLDCLGRGPGGKILLGRKVAYERTAFINWLMERLDKAKG